MSVLMDEYLIGGIILVIFLSGVIIWLLVFFQNRHIEKLKARIEEDVENTHKNNYNIGVIRRVWVIEGCIPCGACEMACPIVFHELEDDVHIRSEVREDFIESTNRVELSAIRSSIRQELTLKIIEAAEGCPVEVIHFD